MIKSKLFLIAAIVAVVIIIDQFTKQYITANMSLYESIPVIKDIFHITYTRNSGVAFSLLSNIPASVRTPFFIVTNLAVLSVICWYFIDLLKSSRYVSACFGLIIGGAAGNLIDRVRVGQVIDFLEVGINQSLKWPVFNAADSCISIGV
ncbi:MAG: signal peptidase II, partial [Candidatus Firestonebacteria bacterium]